MVMRQITVREDDLDGSTADVKPTVFGVEGKLYAADLSAANRQRLEEAVRPFVEVAFEFGELPVAPEDPATLPQSSASNGAGTVAEPAVAPRARRPAKAATAGTEDKASTQVTPASGPTVMEVLPPTASELRQWGNDNGHSVAPTGAIPRALKEAYEKAHAPKPRRGRKAAAAKS